MFGRTSKGDLRVSGSINRRSAIDHRVFRRRQIASYELCELVQSHHAQASFPAHQNGVTLWGFCFFALKMGDYRPGRSIKTNPLPCG